MSSFFQKLKQGASDAGKLAQLTVEVNKLKLQISAKTKEIEKKYSQIGEAVFQAYKQNNISQAEGLVAANSNQILQLEEEIQSIDLKLKQLRNEKECSCGKVVLLDAKFCPVCGHPFEVQE